MFDDRLPLNADTVFLIFVAILNKLKTNIFAGSK